MRLSKSKGGESLLGKGRSSLTAPSMTSAILLRLKDSQDRARFSVMSIARNSHGDIPLSFLVSAFGIANKVPHEVLTSILNDGRSTGIGSYGRNGKRKSKRYNDVYIVYFNQMA